MNRRIKDPGSEHPLLFLDVDGVLNAFAFDSRLASFDDFEEHEVMLDEGNGFRMILDLCLSRSMGERIGALSAEIVWATTWEHNADSIVAPLCGLPRSLRVLTRPRSTTRMDGAWKFDEVRRVVTDEMRPFVRGQFSVPAFGHEKSPPLGADVQFLSSVGRPPFARASFIRNDSPSVTTITL